MYESQYHFCDLRGATSRSAPTPHYCMQHVTPLHFAAQGGYASVVSLLLADPRVDVNRHCAVSLSVALSLEGCVIIPGPSLPCSLVPQVGRTPLHCAAECGHANVVSLLLADSRQRANELDNVSAVLWPSLGIVSHQLARAGNTPSSLCSHLDRPHLDPPAHAHLW